MNIKTNSLKGESETNSTTAQPSVARSTALMAVATLSSRATGLIRTWAMAYALGLTLITSSYQIANNLPNIIYELVAGGLLAAAFVPLYIQQTEALGREGGDRYASNLLNLVIIVLGSLSILATFFAPQMIATQTFTIEDDAAVTDFAVFFFRIFAIQMLFYGLGGVFTSILNAHRIFFITALAPLFNNILVIASFFAYPLLFPENPELAIIVLAVGTTLGVVAQFAIQIPAMIRLGFKYRPRIDLSDPALKDTIKIGIPMVIYVVGLLVSFSFRNAFALQTGDDGVGTLIYAWTWFQLPHGIMAASLARALFTEMSSAFAREDTSAFKHHLKIGISGTLLICLPMAGLMCVLNLPLMQIFRAGAFDAEDVAYVGSVLAVWILALPFYSVQQFMFNVYSSIRRFTLFSLICTVLCVFQCLLYGLLSNPSVLGLVGIPVSDIIFYALALLILVIVLRRLQGNIGLKAVFSTGLRVLLATIIGSTLAAIARALMPLGEGIVGGLLEIAVYGGGGLLLIFLLCHFMQVPEMAIFTKQLKRIRGRIKHP